MVIPRRLPTGSVGGSGGAGNHRQRLVLAPDPSFFQRRDVRSRAILLSRATRVIVAFVEVATVALRRRIVRQIIRIGGLGIHAKVPLHGVPFSGVTGVTFSGVDRS